MPCSDPARDGTSSSASKRREVALLFAKLGVIGFGGPAAHIALMRDEVVRRFAIAGTERQVREQLRRYEGVADWAMFSGPRTFRYLPL